MAGVPMKLHRDKYGGPLEVNKLAYFLPKGHSICNFEAILIIGDQQNEYNYPGIRACREPLGRTIYPVKR